MPESLIRLSDVMRRTGFSKAWIYRLMENDLFPKSVKIGPRAIAFLESEVNAFINGRIKRTRGIDTKPSELDMTPSSLPQRCWRPLAEVKAYVEKFPDGVDLTQLNNKVNCYGILNKKEKSQVINHLEQRESILIIKAKPINSAGREKTFLRHKKYGYPKSIAGYIYPITKAEPEKAAAEPAEPFHVEEPVIEEIKMADKSPESLRKQAEALLKEAEEAERKSNESDLFNKKLQPVRLEMLQAIATVQKLFYQQMDAMSVLETAAAKLRAMTA